MKKVSDFFAVLGENGGAMQVREDYLHTIHNGAEDFSTCMTYLSIVEPGCLHVRQEDWDNWERSAYPSHIPVDKTFDLSGMMDTSLDEVDLVDGHYHVHLKDYYPEESRVWWSFNPFTIRRGRSRDGIAAGDCAPDGK